ncbi:uncharacterized protein FIESC28_01676 [Fusarium coffeatum]|uniref:Uncharacterized protein n=1 Tax=Fusarium coffeatum TaxID=231269 RepID=A0A366S943_9HYPO|nr:uncharacterized protein FIESC28_01676 [Fusarium coffeatum]RBR25438.1 hypothetical protein FIESC28_01676 [Fusarium coffeatum]
MESETASVEWEWPEYDGNMDIDEPEPELFVPEEEPPVPDIPWQELQELQIVKEKRLCELSREIHQGPYYTSLPNSEVDWSLEGRIVCRVVRCPFYGHEFQLTNFRKHLHSTMHRRLDEWYESEVAVPSPSPELKSPTPERRGAGVLPPPTSPVSA